MVLGGDFGVLATKKLPGPQFPRGAAWLGTLAIACLSVIAYSQQQQIFKDGAGDMVATGWKSFQWVKGSPQVVTMKAASGQKMKLVSKLRHMTLETSGAKAQIVTKGNNLQLQTLTLSGGIHGTVTRPSSNQKSKESQTATLDGETATYTAAAQEIELTGGVTIDDEDPGAPRTLHATGSAGTVHLSEVSSRESALKDAILKGPVDMTLSGLRNDGGKMVPIHVHATCGQVRFSDADRTVEMTGNVHLTSDDKLLSEFRSQRVVLKLSDTNDIESLDAGEGDFEVPATALGGKGG